VKSGFLAASSLMTGVSLIFSASMVTGVYDFTTSTSWRRVSGFCALTSRLIIVMQASKAVPEMKYFMIMVLYSWIHIIDILSQPAN
jgi:hypothetical protein